MTAVDRAELKRVERLKAMAAFWDSPEPSPCEPEGYEPSLGGRGLFSRDLSALLSEIEGLKAERDEWKGEWEAACSERIADREKSQEVINERDKWIVELIQEREALRTQAPDSWRPDREAVARTVRRAIGDAWIGEHQAEVAADAILALRPQTAESGE